VMPCPYLSAAEPTGSQQRPCQKNEDQPHQRPLPRRLRARVCDGARHDEHADQHNEYDSHQVERMPPHIM
jgi:hypothetical protein